MEENKAEPQDADGMEQKQAGMDGRPDNMAGPEHMKDGEHKPTDNGDPTVNVNMPVVQDGVPEIVTHLVDIESFLTVVVLSEWRRG